MSTPFSSWNCMSITPNIGTSKADMPMMNASKKTMGDYLWYLFMILFKKCSPIIEPIIHQNPIVNAYSKFSMLYIIYTILEPALENMIMYIPVEDDTDGETPMLSRTGLNMAPPPKPSAPATHPPTNAKKRSFLKVDP